MQRFICLSSRNLQDEAMSSRVSANLRFFRQWLRNPVQTGAITPSSPELASAVLAELPQGARRVIELGGGTGVFTQALLDWGIAPSDLLVLELNPILQAQLAARFPEARVLRGDAQFTAELALQSGYLEQGAADAVVSGLGLLTMNRETQSAVLQSAFACLAPDGVMVQFTYGPISPVNEGLLLELGFAARRGEFVLRNVPPATVWTIRRSRAKAIRPRTVHR
jgi:phosphatidylethanolamine/phosphatidyl-N-methylethanolamine N-methyltransferase